MMGPCRASAREQLTVLLGWDARIQPTPLTRVDGRPAAGCTPVRVPGTGPGAAMLHPAAGNSGGREMPVAEGPAHDFGFPVAAATRRSRAYA